MKIKYKLLALLFVTIFAGCEDDTIIQQTTPDGLFLTDPGIGVLVIDQQNGANQAFNITWTDNENASATYDVELATDDLFQDAISIGTSDTNSFVLSRDALNTFVGTINSNVFIENTVYLRVSAGSLISNFVSFVIIPIQDEPEMLSPTGGENFMPTVETSAEEAMNVSWLFLTDQNLTIDYTVEIALAGTDFATVAEVGTVTNMFNLSVTNSGLNNAAIDAGIPVEGTGDLDLRVKASYMDLDQNMVEVYSEVRTFTMTTYLSVLDLSTTWGVVGSAANDWGNGGPDLPFWETGTSGVIAAYVSLIDGEIKFRENNMWGTDYGDSDGDGILDQNANNNIAVSAGDYKITIDLNDLSYTIEPFSLGIVGSAFNNWGASPDFMLQYDQYSDTFRGIATLLDGEMKFRMNNDWGQDNWGDANADGILDMDPDNNISVTAGIYIVIVDLNTLEYSLEEIQNVWGLVGSAFNNWGATPDAQFNRDWSKPFNDAWILENVTLLDGEFKIRPNNTWGNDYGDATGDGILDQDSNNNIAVTAGNYTIELDFTNPSAPTIVITQL